MNRTILNVSMMILYIFTATHYNSNDTHFSINPELNLEISALALLPRKVEFPPWYVTR